MTNQEILKKAIEKAEKNGYKSDWIDHVNTVISPTSYYYVIIFDHEFAKCFFGVELVCNNCGNNKMFVNQSCKKCECDYFVEAWQYHLQQLVLQKEPLKYLEKFI